MKFLIVTADDFGLHESVNEAVLQAHGRGVLTAASLMPGAPAAADAVRRARCNESLRVGLHVVLADGRAMLRAEQIPALAEPGGWMNARMLGKSFQFLRPRVRAQLEAEIRAQFKAFARTGLELDHVNAHKHFHLHPVVFDMLLRIGREYGAPPMRLPDEPLWFAARPNTCSANALGVKALGATLQAGLMSPWLAYMKRRMRARRVLHNDSLFGISSSGAMNEQRLLSVLSRLPAGVTEIYLHPAASDAIAASMPHYNHRAELAALLSSRVRAAVDSAGIPRGGYRDIPHGVPPRRP